MSNNDNKNNNKGLMVFSSELFGDLRIMTIDGEETFNLSDVCFGLGYTKLAKGKLYLRKDEIENICETLDIKGLSGGDNSFLITKDIDFENTYISEDNFYDLCLESRAKNARTFRRWVTSEVLPSIRKHGCYIGEDADVQYISNELRFSSKRTIKTFASADVYELKALYNDFVNFMNSEYKHKTDRRISGYKSVEKGLQQLHDNIARQDVTKIGDCYNIRLLKEQIILDRTKLEKKSLGGDKGSKTKEIRYLNQIVEKLLS